MKDINGNQIAIDFNAPKPPLNLRGGAEGGGVTDTDLTHEEMEILEILKNHRGRENAITGHKIEAATNIHYDRVREVITHMVNKHRILIGSWVKGYYIPLVDSDVRETTKHLRNRLIKIAVHISNLEKISMRDIFHQTLIDFEKGEAA